MNVFGILRRFYVKHIGSKFITRLMLFCSIINVVVIVVLSYLINTHISEKLKDQAVKSSVQALDSIESYFVAKYENVKSFNRRIYIDTNARANINQFLTMNFKDSPGEDIRLRQWISSSLYDGKTFQDHAIQSANIFGTIDGRHLELMTSAEERRNRSYFAGVLNDAIRKVEAGHIGQRINHLSDIQFNENGEFSGGTLSIYDLIRDAIDMPKVVGIVSFNYNLQGISKDLSNILNETGGTILLVSEDNKLMYDSSGSYSLSSYELPAKLQGMTNGLAVNDGVVGIRTNDRFGFSVISIITEDTLYASIRTLNIYVIVLTTLGLLFVVIVTGMYSKLLSRRIGRVLKGIEKIEAGRLDVKTPVSQKNDEIDLISSSLNRMCERLDEQIRKEFEADAQRKQALIHQKDAEIYALQSQINPHFLFNMLEVVRMKAVIEGSQDTATMVRLLSDIFRNNIGRDLVTSIGEELEYCLAYMELFSLRSSEGIQTNIEVDAGIKKQAILTHILQPILENALIHGVDGIDDPEVSIIGRLDKGSDIVFEIRDNGSGMTLEELADLRQKILNYGPDGDKVGLANVNKRIKMVYGEAYGLEVESVAYVGTVVRIRIKSMSRSEVRAYA